jgi:hypothetical protein
MSRLPPASSIYGGVYGNHRHFDCRPDTDISTVGKIVGYVPRNPVVTRAAENYARTGSSGLSAPFCPLAILLSAYRSIG